MVEFGGGQVGLFRVAPEVEEHPSGFKDRQGVLQLPLLKGAALEAASGPKELVFGKGGLGGRGQTHRLLQKRHQLGVKVQGPRPGFGEVKQLAQARLV